MTTYTYWISYTLESDDRYDERYSALMLEIAVQTGIEWNENTSFVVAESPLDIASLSSKLKAIIDISVDRIVIRRMDAKIARYIGNFDDLTTLLKLMPYIVES